MTISNRSSQRYVTVLVLVISLLLVSGYVAKAQTKNTDPAATATPTPTPTATTTPTPAANDTKAGADQSGAKTTASPDIRAKLLETTWYPLVISLLFAALIIGFAATIIRVILRSKSSFRSPLGLPEGSLRAMLAFMLVAFLGFYVYGSLLSLSSEFKLPDALLGIIATVIGFYFGSRSVEGAGARPAQTGSVHGMVVDNSGSPAGGATVELSQASGKKLTQTADLSGEFKFDEVLIGDYNIQASKTGHTASDPTKVKVSAGKTETVKLSLK